jgi:hypothetical protein
VTRGVTLLAASFLAALALVATAAGERGPRALRGVVASVSDASIAFTASQGKSLTCDVGPKSPSVAGYAAGDRVEFLCVKLQDSLVLVRLHHLAAASGDVKPQPFGGTVTALSATSITIHDGNSDLTCAITAASPSTAHVSVGSHVRVGCANGNLVAIAVVTLPPVGAPPPPPQTGATPPPPSPGGDDGGGQQHTVATVGGVITALTDASLTVHGTEHGNDVTCTRSESSPALDGYAIGDHVGIACVDGVLAKIVRL